MIRSALAKAIGISLLAHAALAVALFGPGVSQGEQSDGGGTRSALKLRLAPDADGLPADEAPPADAVSAGDDRRREREGTGQGGRRSSSGDAAESERSSALQESTQTERPHASASAEQVPEAADKALPAGVRRFRRHGEERQRSAAVKAGGTGTGTDTDNGSGAGTAAAGDRAERKAPRLAQALSPEYPFVSRKLGEEGTAVVRAHVGERGTVLSARLVESSGSRRLDERAMDAVRAARFRPARNGNRAAEADVAVRVEFRLDG